jgi:hypothetical protein
MINQKNTSFKLGLIILVQWEERIEKQLGYFGTHGFLVFHQSIQNVFQWTNIPELNSFDRFHGN